MLMDALASPAAVTVSGWVLTTIMAVVVLLTAATICLSYNNRRKVLASSEDVQDYVDSLPEAALVVGRDGSITYMNRSAQQLSSTARNELLAWLKSANNGKSAGNTVALDQAGAGQGEFEIDVGCVRFRGRPSWLLHVRDVTDRKRAERQLTDQKTLLEALLQSTTDGIVTCDERGVLSLFNEVTREMHGLPQTPLPADAWGAYYDLYRADGSTPMPMEEIPLFRAFNGEQLEDALMVIAPASQQRRTVQCSAQPLIDAEGRKIGAMASMRDITDTLRAERALRESENLLRSAFNSAAHCMVLADLDGVIVNVNQQLGDFLGCEQAAMLGKPFSGFIAAEQRGDVARELEALIAGRKETVRLEIDCVHADASTLPCLLSAGLARTGEESVSRLVLQLVDLSATKQAEHMYYRAQKMEAVGNLTGGVAHDFNNILGIVIGYLQMLKKRLGDKEDLAKLIAPALTAAHRGADLTGQLLAFSRKQELAPRVVDPRELICELETLVQRTLGANVSVITQCADDVGRIRVDKSQLESAILNLAINARDAMPDGGKLVISTNRVFIDERHAREHKDAHTGQHVCISVSDTGVGIPEEIRDKIFEPFVTTKEVGKGTGLGLSMVYGFVRQTGGHIHVYTETGQGTCFRIYLPETDDAVEESADVESHAPLPAKASVLVVEDDPDLRQTARMLLEDMGMTVYTAESGPAALVALGSLPSLDLLFTDMVMPGGMNGHELGRAVRAQRPGIPVLLTSGFPRDAFDNGREYPLLQKPYSQEALAAAIGDCLTIDSPPAIAAV